MTKTLSSRDRNSLSQAEQELVNKEANMIANELRLWLPDDERLQIKRTPKTELAKFSSSLGRAIRNEYDLWLEEHHVTKIYLAAEAKFPLSNSGVMITEVDLGDGKMVTVHSNTQFVVEDHPCHPDNFSQRCIERLWEIIQ